MTLANITLTSSTSTSRIHQSVPIKEGNKEKATLDSSSTNSEEDTDLAKKLKNEKGVKVRKTGWPPKLSGYEKNGTTIRHVIEMDSSSIKTVKYVRYADDFLIGITGNLEDCKTVKGILRII